MLFKKATIQNPIASGFYFCKVNNFNPLKPFETLTNRKLFWFDAQNQTWAEEKPENKKDELYYDKSVVEWIDETTGDDKSRAVLKEFLLSALKAGGHSSFGDTIHIMFNETQSLKDLILEALNCRIVYIGRSGGQPARSYNEDDMHVITGYELEQLDVNPCKTINLSEEFMKDIFIDYPGQNITLFEMQEHVDAALKKGYKLESDYAFTCATVRALIDTIRRMYLEQNSAPIKLS
jgi:hypothetical protein